MLSLANELRVEGGKGDGKGLHRCQRMSHVHIENLFARLPKKKDILSYIGCYLFVVLFSD